MTILLVVPMLATSAGCSNLGVSIAYAAEAKDTLSISEVKKASNVLTFTIKNISDKTVSMGDSLGMFSVTVSSISKKDGKILGQPTKLSLVLQPRETRPMEILLFPSDETIGKMTVGYLGFPAHAQGKYIKAQSEVVRQIEDKLSISYELTTKPGQPHAWFVGEIKNISGAALTLPTKDDWLTLKITFIDEKGEKKWATWPQINLPILNGGPGLAPGESVGYESEVEDAKAATIARYEIQLYYWTPSLGKDGTAVN